MMKKFTFQYVSILITSSRDFLVRRLGFTFQYVSILIAGARNCTVLAF